MVPEQQHVQEHVQHEFGVLHPGGEHKAHAVRASNPEAPTAVADMAAPAAAEASTPKAKRARKQQDSPAQQSTASVQVAPVQAVTDVKAFVASAARYGVYCTVQPQLLDDVGC